MKIDTMLSLQQHTSALVKKKNRIHNHVKIYFLMPRYFIRNH